MGISSLLLAVGKLVTETQVSANSPTQDHFFNFWWFLVYDRALHELHFEHSHILLMKPTKAM